MAEYPLKWITKHLAVGYAPRSNDDLRSLKQQGIQSVLNLCAKCYDLHEIEQVAGFDVYYLPIPDEDAPNLDEMAQALTWLETKLAEGKKILVHCQFGIGRTGTLMTAYFLKNGYSLKEAHEKMRHTPAAPASQIQRDYLDVFSKKLDLSKLKRSAGEGKKSSGLGKFFENYNKMKEWLE